MSVTLKEKPRLVREAFTRTLRPGTVPTWGGGRMSVFVSVKFDGERLSITGVEGPRANGNATGSVGQIAMGYAHRDPADNDARERTPTGPEAFNFAAGWDAEAWLSLLDVWKRWHLNDMRAECEHQRELGWKYETHKGQACPVCGYVIGTEWRRETVPADVLDFLLGLPESDRVPAWV